LSCKELLDFADLEEFFENSLTGFIIADPAEVILHANLRFAEWVRVERGTLAGQRFSNYLSIPGKIYVETHLAPLLRMQGSFDEVALELVPASGPRVPVLVNARERKSNGDKPTSTAYVIFKSAERHQYETDLLAVRNELRNLNSNLTEKVQEEVRERLTAEGRFTAEHEAAQLREQFIAVLGHDLRNPLAGIEAGLKMVLRTQVNDKAASIISLMQNSVERMNALVSDLMDLARTRMGGGLLLQYQVVQLEPIITHVVAEILATSSSHRIELQLDLPMPVECDPMRIAQLLSNLVGNAISHGETSGLVKVIGTSNGSIIEIRVSNRGPVIPPEILDQLFQPFHRNETGQARLGLGLGLYICSEITRAHGGELKVRSTADETVFTFRMPVKKAIAKQSAPLGP
jgi:sigma-B regulation protein RsbU (phosphoserine phosphatase)